MKVEKGWVDEAIVCPSPNYNQRPPGDEPSLLVIHNISLPPGQFGNGHIQCFFQNQLDISADPYFDEISDLQVSAHFLIARDGELTQFVSCDERAWHAGQSNFCGRENCNDFSIGIELEGQDDTPYEAAQYDTLLKVTQAIMQAYPSICVDQIVGHSDIAPGRKTDPGEAFDWERYRKALA